MEKPNLIKVVPVTAIDFGKNDGKFDAIEKYFYDTGLTDKILNGDKSIIIGRKGTGKTALAYHIYGETDRNPIQLSRILSFKDVPVGLMEQFTDLDHKSANRFILLWRYVFLIELAKLIVRDESILDERKTKLITFLDLNFPGLKSSPREYLKETVEKKFKVTFKIIEAELKSTQADGVINLLSFVSDLQELIRDLAQIGNKYIVVIDELDDIYDGSREYFDILTGMFKAGMELNYFFGSQHKAVRTVMMLRSDIYESISYADKNKWSDMTHEIEWIPAPDERAFGSQLFQMINLRIGASLVDDPHSGENYWGEVFPNVNIIAELKPFQFILSRSYYRPRDIIQFCKEIKEEAIKHKLKTAYTRDVILNAEYRYSKWFENEILDEVCVKIPYIKDVFEAFKRHGQATFTAKDINTQFQRFRVVESLPLNSVLEILYEFSVIGMFLENDSTKPVFGYREPDIDFKESRKYSIHYGLRPALRMGDRFRDRHTNGYRR